MSHRFSWHSDWCTPCQHSNATSSSGPGFISHVVMWRKDMTQDDRYKEVCRGDTITFNWEHTANSQHNVERLNTRDDFDACRVTMTVPDILHILSAHYFKNILRRSPENGPRHIEITEPANTNIYFVCGVGDHCMRNQKLHVRVRPDCPQRSYSYSTSSCHRQGTNHS